MGKYRDMIASDIHHILVKEFTKLEENDTIGLTVDTPEPYIWTVDVTKNFHSDREAAERYFQQLYEEESRKGNASEITIVTEI